MPKKRIHSITEVVRKPSLIRKSIPFDITYNGRVIATITHPDGVWRECENCGENTKNIIEFKDKHGEWQKLILCDKCSEELL